MSKVSKRKAPCKLCKTTAILDTETKLCSVCFEKKQKTSKFKEECKGCFEYHYLNEQNYCDSCYKRSLKMTSEIKDPGTKKSGGAFQSQIYYTKDEV